MFLSRPKCTSPLCSQWEAILPELQSLGSSLSMHAGTQRVVLYINIDTYKTGKQYVLHKTEV